MTTSRMPMGLLLASVAVAAAVLAGCSPPGLAQATGDECLVTTPCATYRGRQEGAGCVFQGIPYAAPPLGSRRWSDPEPALCDGAVRDAGEFGAVCPQLDRAGKVGGDEDCLTLNVWTPLPPGQGRPPLPAMVWYHGGGNHQGSSSEPIYDGRRLAAAGPAVVVTGNYRLGALGFLGHTALSAASPHRVSGNYGILDQMARLRWVRDHIAAFGGDPSRVTIFGQSAGAQDVWILLASPLARGLFHRAIAHSGNGFALSLSEVEAVGRRIADLAGCGGAADVAACLRAVPAAKLIPLLPGTGGLGPPKLYAPAVDGYVLPDATLRVVSRGVHNPVPFIGGTTAHETALDIVFNYVRNPEWGPTIDEGEYAGIVGELFGSLGSAAVRAILSRYPATAYGSPVERRTRRWRTAGRRRKRRCWPRLPPTCAARSPPCLPPEPTPTGCGGSGATRTEPSGSPRTWARPTTSDG